MNVGLRETEPGTVAAAISAASHSDKRPAVFLHIPKTAGTSFIRTIANAFGHNRTRRFHSIDEAEIDRVLSELIGDFACLSGHLPYHMVAPWCTGDTVFTMLRHPVARVMSLFHFLRGRPDDERNRLGLKPNFSFEDFINSDNPELFGQINDGMTRMLCGDPQAYSWKSTRFWSREPSTELVQMALNTLDSIHFGVTEDMDTALAMARVAWDIPYELQIGRDNAAEHAGAQPDLHRSLAIIVRNSMDLMLYERAEALLARRRSLLGLKPMSTSVTGALHMPVPGLDVGVSDLRGMQGFHEVEAIKFAWIDGQQYARLHCAALEAPARIRLWCYAVHDHYPIEKIAIDVNGSPVATSASFANRRWFTLETASAPLRQPVNCVAIRPPYFVPARYIDPSSLDERSLAIALSSIHFAR